MHTRGSDTAQQRRSDRDKLFTYAFKFFVKGFDCMRLLGRDFFFQRKKNIRAFPRNPTTPITVRIKQRTRLALTPAGEKT